MERTFYRPEWTCGRYDKAHGASIYYNLIEGMSYFFEDESASVIGFILSKKRNSSFSVSEMSAAVGITSDELIPFLDELQRFNLITSSPITENGISEYRSLTANWKMQERKRVAETTRDKLPFAVTNAEMAYAERVGGVTGLMLELTYNCSEKCIHCYNFGATRNENEISHRGDLNELNLDDYKRIIDDAYNEGLIKVTLSGGDPFSKSIVWDIIDYLFSKDIAFDVYTNGQRLVSDTERLSKYYPRVVGISIYSTESAVHDYITRIPGSWERSVSVAKELASLSVPMNIKCCVMQPNFKSYRGITEFAHSLGAEPQYEISITDSIEGDKCATRFLRLTPKQYEIVLRDDNIKLYVGPEAPNYGGQPRDMTQNGCGAAYNTFCVDPEGNLIACCSFHAVFGNLKEQKIEEILKESQLLKDWKASTLEDYEECGRYDYCAYCNLCPGNAFVEHGNWLKAAENNCFIAKIRHDLAKKMMQGYDPLNGMSIDEAILQSEDYKEKKLGRTFNVPTEKR